MGRDGGVGFRTSEGNAETGAQKTKWREFTTEMVTDQHFPDQTLFSHLPQQAGAAFRGSGFGESDPRERTGVDCH